jgi:hypothetical protein
MRAHRLLVLALLATCGLLGSVARAQDFHVETTLWAIGPGEAKELQRSITLFHAGKTYDFIPGVGELIIFDPAHKQFRLVSTRLRKTTEVHIDEINRMLGIARSALNDHVQGLQARAQADQNAIDQILFQFNPQFDKSMFQTKAGPELVLKSKYFEYSVLAAQPPTPQHAFVYLNYADWISRLNYVVMPGGILPEQRIVLDSALRQTALVPIEVNFKIVGGQSPMIRASHHIYWQLNERDRELLSQWDGMIARNELKPVTFKEYQQALLPAQASHRR